MLEEAGIEPYLVNAKHVKNVTGRKKDDTDAIWLQKLHCCGLLQKSFQPDEETRVLRTYVRQRRNLVLIGSDSVRRMQKALELMNIKLHTVISDILSKTGLLMVKAIIRGERDVEELIKLKDPRIEASDEDIKKSLAGIRKKEYLFTLKQAYEEYLFYQGQIQACEELILEQLLKQVAIVSEGEVPNVPLKKKRRKNQMGVEIQPLLKILTGVDLCRVEGISEISCLELVSEIGTDMTKWPGPKNFAGQTLRMSASGLTRSKSPLGNYARKMRSRLGKKGGVVATANKLSAIIYSMIIHQTEYNPEIMKQSTDKWTEKRIKSLEKQLDQLKKAS